MEPVAYKELAETEDNGWYYRVRLQFVKELIKRYGSPTDKKMQIVDIGCGTGGSTRGLMKFGDVTGIEPSPIARDYLRQKFPNLKVIACTVQDLPKHVAQESFDLAVILGVLYHREVADPAQALANVYKLLKPGGLLIWNEAAHSFLKRQHDVLVHGARRFAKSEAKESLAACGFKLLFFRHLLTWAFPIGLALALYSRVRGKMEGREQSSPDQENRFFFWLSSLEWRLGHIGLKLPLGISWLLVAQKPHA